MHWQSPKNGNVCNYWIMRLDLATGKHIEEPKRLTNWPSFCVGSGSITNDDKRTSIHGVVGIQYVIRRRS